MKRDYDRNKRIPADLYEAFVRAAAESGNAWEEAKNASDFSIYAPHLRNMIEMTKQVIGYTDPGKDVYDALLEQCEEGMDQATIDRLFEEVKTELVPCSRADYCKENAGKPTFHAYADRTHSAGYSGCCLITSDSAGMRERSGRRSIRLRRIFLQRMCV